MVYIICTHLAPTPLLEVRNAELYEYWCPNASKKPLLSTKGKGGFLFLSAAWSIILFDKTMIGGCPMFELNEYLQELISECKSAFGGRLLYVGLQGSYMRGEAKENSDIDVMVILDDFSVKDMDVYRGILQKIGYFEKSCGFICGRDEMARWNPLEVCQLKNTTKDLHGTLSQYLPDARAEDEINYVKFSLGNLYHELCHRYIHANRERNAMKLRFTCKGLFFLIQNLYYLESGEFVTTKSNLMGKVSEEDRRALALTELPDDYDFDKAFSSLFEWCQDAFCRIDRIKPEASGLPSCSPCIF